MKFTNQLIHVRTTAEKKITDWGMYETECTEKINRNLRNINQFRENADHIGPTLKSRYDKKVAELQQKNEILQQDLDRFRSLRQTQLSNFKKDQNSTLDAFKESFNHQMSELV
jgi:hypothetical protein